MSSGVVIQELELEFEGLYYLYPPNKDENYNEIAYVSLARHVDSESFYARAVGTESLVSMFNFIRNKMEEDKEELAQKAKENVIYLAVPKKEEEREELGVLAVVVSKIPRESLYVTEGSIFQLASLEKPCALMIGY